MICPEAEHRRQVFAERHSGAASCVAHICNCDARGRCRISELNELFDSGCLCRTVGPIHFHHYRQYSFVDSSPQHALIIEQSPLHGKAEMTAENVVHFTWKRHLQESHFPLVFGFDELTEFCFPLRHCVDRNKIVNKFIFAIAAAAGMFESWIRHEVAEIRTDQHGPECLVAIVQRQV